MPHLLHSFTLFGLLLTSPSFAGAQQGTPGDATLRGFRFGSGDTLDLRIHYVTFGRPHRSSGAVDNAVLILHATGGSIEQFLNPGFAGELFGPGQPLDSAAFYIIIPDAIGHGKSSKPSDGLRGRFPHYTYDDMVRAQRALLADHLGIQHLRLVLGTSMGCMHSWVWAETDPEFMDAVVPLACLPSEIAGRNRIWRRMAMDDIRSDPDWDNGDYARQPRGLRAALQILLLESNNPLVYQRLAPTRDSADSWVRETLDRRMTTTDANDLLFALDASREYDPRPKLDRIQARVLAINTADDEINPPELGVMEQLMPRVARGRYVLIPAGEKTRGHGTHTAAAVWKGLLGELLQPASHPLGH